METYLILLAIAIICRAIHIGNLIQTVVLKVLFPHANIKEVESFIKNTKTKFNFPKSSK